MSLEQGFQLLQGHVVKLMPELRGAGETPVSTKTVMEKQYLYQDTWVGR